MHTFFLIILLSFSSWAFCDNEPINPVAADSVTTTAPLSGTVTPDNKLKLTWVHPTKRVDGKDLDIGEIAYTKVTWNCQGKVGSTKVLAPANTLTVGLPKPGECTYTLNTGDTTGNESKDSIPYTYGEEVLVPVAPVPPEWETDFLS